MKMFTAFTLQSNDVLGQFYQFYVHILCEMLCCVLYLKLVCCDTTLVLLLLDIRNKLHKALLVKSQIT